MRDGPAGMNGYDGPLVEEKPLLAAAQGGLSSPEYVDLCRWLATRLQPLCDLEESITSGPDDMDSLQVEMSGLLKELHCPFKEVVSGILKGRVLTTKDHLKCVLFLSSELQAAQIVRSGRVSDQQQQGESPVCQELLAICETLNLPEPGGQDAAGVFSQVQDKVDEILKGLPNGSVGNPVLKKPLSSEQWEKLNNINTVLSSEYECRRRMLIKRLDVTVQSFGWSDRAKVKVDSMARAYQPRRHSLRPQSTVDMAELLAARDDICNVVKTSSGSSREKTVCAVNKSRTEEDVPRRYKLQLLRCHPGKKDKKVEEVAGEAVEEVVVEEDKVVGEEEEEEGVVAGEEEEEEGVVAGEEEEVGEEVGGTKEDMEAMEDMVDMEEREDGTSHFCRCWREKTLLHLTAVKRLPHLHDL
ncbi:Protein FAM98B [Collichthys lucidus]|uniref:Protein FAM98B n=1 Tax=Collichthys lucidus TaxID=240159 RepID=A0A4U5VFH9_COLLU|nr:Protein FAM98B [Collichthys lucidus]